MPPGYDIPRPTGVPTCPTDANPTIRTPPAGQAHETRRPTGTTGVNPTIRTTPADQAHDTKRPTNTKGQPNIRTIRAE
jgi:hypothetical protein